jgi:hypothetical protein
MSELIKICSVGAELFLADRPTDRQTADMTKIIAVFCNLKNAPKIQRVLHLMLNSTNINCVKLYRPIGR